MVTLICGRESIFFLPIPLMSDPLTHPTKPSLFIMASIAVPIEARREKKKRGDHRDGKAQRVGYSQRELGTSDPQNLRNGSSLVSQLRQRKENHRFYYQPSENQENFKAYWSGMPPRRNPKGSSPPCYHALLVGKLL